MAEGVRVSVAYVAPGVEFVREVVLPAGASIEQAIAASGVSQAVPQAELAALKAGVWGKARARHAPVSEGDRIELYRALTADPKVARAARAQKKRGS